MKRLLIAMLIAVAVTTLSSPSAALAQSNSLCTARVHNDMSNYTMDPGQLEELTATMNGLAARGVDPHAVFLDTLGPGVADVPQWEAEVLRPACPDLFVGSEPKPDLFMLVVTADRQMGTVFGSELSGVHVFDDYRSTAIDSFRDGDFAGGLSAYEEVVDDRIQHGTTPRADRGGDTAPSIDSGAILTVIAWTAVGVIGLAAAGSVTYVLVNARRRRTLRIRLLKRFDTARGDYSDLEINSMTTIDMARLWIDTLPDSDEATLVNGLHAWDDAFTHRATRIVNDGADVIRAARTDADLDEAGAIVEELIGALDDAHRALADLDAASSELAALDSTFTAAHTEAGDALDTVNELLETRAAEGFSVEPLITDRDELARQHAAAAQAHRDRAIRTAHDSISAVRAKATSIAARLADLPDRPAGIADAVSQIRARIGDLDITRADTGLSRLRESFEQPDWGDLVDHPKVARALIEEASAWLATATEAADTRRIDELDRADSHIRHAQAAVNEAIGAVVGIQERQTELKRLASTLPRDVEKLAAAVEGTTAFITGAGEGYISSATASAVEQLRAQTTALAARLVDSPAFLQLGKDLAALQDDARRLRATAEAEHKAAVEKVEAARRAAERRRDEARRYRTHAGARYRTADDLCAGALVGMSLQQQLDHWAHAYDVADAAYRTGHSGYTASLSSSQTSSSSSWSGGSDGGSWGPSESSASGGSDGGSW